MIIYTIGHSTRSFDEFLGLLKENNIKCLADIRRFPGSRKYPHFGQTQLKDNLAKHNIEYLWFEELAGRQVNKELSIENAGWRNKGFHSYADRINEATFLEHLSMLEDVANNLQTSFMCSEAVWWRCHRQVLSDMLLHRGWVIKHILAKNNVQTHVLPKHATIIEGKLQYPKGDK